MTWYEFVAKAREFGYYKSIFENSMSNGKYEFYKNGYIVVCEGNNIISRDRTPDQMWKIMEALQ